MQFISEYGLFLLQTATLVIAFLLTLAGVVAIATKGKDKEKGKLSIKKLNEKYEKQQQQMQEAVLDKKELKQIQKAEKKAAKKEKSKEKEERGRIFVLKFEGDIRAHAVDSLSREITALLSVATPKDEVLVILESGGGVVNGYGLGASELNRIRQKQIPLTIAIDKVAASGGYMMACVANKIIAAPFAIIGSIGVIAQIPNFNRLLKKNNIDYEQITAGEFKRTLTIFGENTDKAREKMREDIQLIHTQFKDFIAKYRPQLDMDKIATGEYWLAEKAFELKLVDELQTSEDYLISKLNDKDLFLIKFKTKPSMMQKLTESAHMALQRFNSLY